MRALLLGALWLHLASSVLLMGASFMLLLAGPGPAARRWEHTVLAWSRLLVLVAIGSGIGWLLVRTATFEGRPGAALDAGAVARAVLDTWPGLVWLAREGALVVLAAFLAGRVDAGTPANWIAARGQVLMLATAALVLMSASSHAAATTPGTALAVAGDAAHLLATGLWAGALPPLALLLRAAASDGSADSRAYAVRATRRFSGLALLAMLALIGSGTWSALVQVDTVASLIGTAHGRLLVAKLTLLIPIVWLAVVNRRRLLPALDGPGAMRRLAAFVTVEAALALGVLGLAAAMTLTTPARHAEPSWPLPFRLTLELPPRLHDAYPTAYTRPKVTYQAASIASGLTIYRERCAVCHEGPGRVDLRSDSTSRRLAGEIFWLLTHGIPARGMPEFGGRLGEAERWDVINFIRASAAAAAAAGAVGVRVEPDRAWLVAPDFTVAMGPLAPGALRDHRGRRMVLLVLYTLPGSRARMRELARSYDVLSILGVEVIAVPTEPSADALAQLGQAPPVLFPVLTDGSADVVATYRLFAPGGHAEVLVDRQGYVRAIWPGAPPVGAVQAQVETLNAEKSPPPFPDDHVH